MGFLDFFAARKQDKQKKEILKLVDQAIQKSFSLKNPDPLKQFLADMIGADQPSVARPYASSVWVYRCINLWMRVGQIPLVLQDKNGKPAQSAPHTFLLESPASTLSQSAFVEHLLLSLGIGGEFFILREDGYNVTPTSVPKYLTIVSPKSMLLLDSDKDKQTGRIKSWTLRLSDGTQKTLPAEGVIHERLPNPYDSHRGLSPIDSIRLTIDGDYAARSHNKWMMERHGRITGVVSFPEQVGAEHLKLMQNMFEEKFSGPENAGKTVFMDNNAKYQQLSLSSKDLDWLEGQKLSREEICAAFGIPPNNAGILDKATYSNFEQSSVTLWDDTLIPLGRRIENALNRWIFMPSSANKYKVKFDFENNVKVIQSNEKDKVERYTKLVNAFISPAEAARIAGISLGKPDPAHNVIWVNANQIPATEESVFAREEPKPEPIADDTKVIDTDAIRKTLLATAGDKQADTQTTDTHGIEYELRQARGRSILRQAAGYERQLRQVINRYFKDQHKYVADNMAKISDHLQKQSASGVVIKIKQTPEEMADMMLRGKDWNAEFLKRVNPMLRSISVLSAKNTLTELGRDKSDFKENTLRNFWQQQQTLLKKVNDTTRQALVDSSRTMIDSLSEGKSPEESAAILQDKVREAFGRTAEQRAIAISRTETLRSINGARFEEMKEADIAKHEWLAVMDSATRESHADVDGESVRIGEKFSNGLEYPGDPSGDAAETINCRCTTIAVFK